MSQAPVDPASDYGLKKLGEAISADIRRELKQRVMKIVEAEIDAVIDEAVDSLKPRVQSYCTNYGFNNTIEFIVRRQAA